MNNKKLLLSVIIKLAAVLVCTVAFVKIVFM